MGCFTCPWDVESTYGISNTDLVWNLSQRSCFTSPCQCCVIPRICDLLGLYWSTSLLLYHTLGWVLLLQKGDGLQCHTSALVSSTLVFISYDLNHVQELGNGLSVDCPHSIVICDRKLYTVIASFKLDYWRVKGHDGFRHCVWCDQLHMVMVWLMWQSVLEKRSKLVRAFRRSLELPISCFLLKLLVSRALGTGIQFQKYVSNLFLWPLQHQTCGSAHWGAILILKLLVCSHRS